MKILNQTYRAVEDHFSHVMAGSCYAELYAVIQHSTQLFDGCEGGEIVLFHEHLIFSDIEKLAGYVNHFTDMKVRSGEIDLRRLQQTFETAIKQQIDPVDELFAFYESLDLEDQKCLEIFFQRAFLPSFALKTFDPKLIFSDAELTKILPLLTKESTADSEGIAYTWSEKDGIVYKGYVCLIMKITRLCNLRCVYCNDWRTGPNQSMSFDILLDVIWKTLRTDQYQHIDFIWHGGEPTLVKRGVYLKVLTMIELFRSPNQKISHDLQTNATSLSTAWLQFLRTFSFSVSISMDGPAEVHDRVRPDTNGNGSFAKVMHGLNMMSDNGFLRNVIIVCTKEIMDLSAERIIRFVRDIDLNNVSFLAESMKSTVPWYADNRRRYFNFLIDLYEKCRELNVETIKIREIDTIRLAIQGKNPGHCELVGNCVGAFYSIEPDGDVFHCDKYIGNAEYLLGNISKSSIKDISKGEAVNRLRKGLHSAEKEHRNCAYFSICHGWCPHERHLASTEAEANCCGLSYFIEALSEKVNLLEHGSCN